MIGLLQGHPLDFGRPPFVELFLFLLLVISVVALAYRLVRRDTGDDGTQF